jgi:hypothetical protein
MWAPSARRSLPSVTADRRMAPEEQTTDARYPEVDDSIGTGLEQRYEGSRRPWTTVLIIVVAVLVLVLLVALHLSGAVGPRAH